MKENYDILVTGEVVRKDSLRVRKHVVGKDGYCRIILSGGGKNQTFYVHRLVWERHRGEIPEGMTVNHKDLDKENNNLHNLELMSQVENLAHARARRKWVVKTNRPWIMRKDVRGRVDGEYGTFEEAARSVGGNAGNICHAVKSGKRSYGWFWGTKEVKA